MHLGQKYGLLLNMDGQCTLFAKSWPIAHENAEEIWLVRFPFSYNNNKKGQAHVNFKIV